MADLQKNWRYGNFRETDRALHFRYAEFKSKVHGDHDHGIGGWQKIAGSDFPERPA